METKEIWSILSLGGISIQNWEKLGNEISNWIFDYAEKNNISTLVVGVSGGIDSAVTSTLCAKTGLNTIVINMPIYQTASQLNLSNLHIEWLKEKWNNVEGHIIDLSEVYDLFTTKLDNIGTSELSLANSRARLRMTTLYSLAGSNNGIVVGTGNKVEDFGVGFYTKYGDGGVDISPIADCTKTQVWELGKHLGISNKIIEAEPTDGLWNDGRNDKDQLGMSYSELEKAMEDQNNPNYKKYLEIRKKNLHKMNPIPICKFDEK